ncbi:hypothetical protein LCGC14_1773360 [marine sediment metagenome]|uniref:Uncharacterized protein n=1 Tax=marine sediment metagenome TaxID=412755 RepID=A0A0F9GXI2_9ZZZZ
MKWERIYLGAWIWAVIAQTVTFDGRKFLGAVLLVVSILWVVVPSFIGDRWKGEENGNG